MNIVISSTSAVAPSERLLNSVERATPISRAPDGSEAKTQLLSAPSSVGLPSLGGGSSVLHLWKRTIEGASSNFRHLKVGICVPRKQLNESHRRRLSQQKT